MSNRQLTLLFTDLEGSTALWEEHGSVVADALALHDSIIETAVSNAGGRIVKHTGDGVFATFEHAPSAVTAAVTFQRALKDHDWPDPPGRLHVRVGVHSGEVLELGDDVFGPAVNRAARVMDAAWADQIVISGATFAGLDGEFTLDDLGAHHLKGLTRSTQLYQVVDEGLVTDFPPLRTLTGFPNNLPSQLPSLFGRDQLADEVVEDLMANPVVTLTGPGGMGKTRLALEVAARAGDRTRDGVWLVELASLDQPEAVAVTTAAVLKVPDRPGRTTIESVAKHLADSETLVVLDNCEHLSDAAAEVAGTLTQASAGVRVLATSREPLWIGGEQVKSVPPLDASGIESAAVALFVARAGAVRPTFDPDEAELATIGRICDRLDGLPLATELAAARVRALPVADIESRLDNRFRLLTGGKRDAGARHDTLETAIAWSYDLLTDEQAVFFTELSVFAGAASLATVEAVLEDDLAIDHLTELADRSLVRVTDADDGSYRYSMFESIRLFARDRLKAARTYDELRERHLTHFAAVAKDLGRRLDGREQRKLLPVLVEILPDLRSAMTSSMDLGQYDKGAKIAAGIYRYWYMRGVREGREWLESFYREREALDPATRAHVLYALGSLLQVVGEYERSASVLQESVELYEDLDNPRGLAYAMHYLARSQWGLIPHQEVLDLFETSTAMFIDVEDKVGEGLGELLVSVLVSEMGDMPRALRHAARFRELADEIGAPQLLAHQREFEGAILRVDGDPRGSVPLLLEALEYYQTLLNPACSAHFIETAAATLVHFDAQGAAELLAATERLRDEIGVPSPPYEALYADEALAKVTALLSDDDFQTARSDGLALELTDALRRTGELLSAADAARRGDA